MSGGSVVDLAGLEKGAEVEMSEEQARELGIVEEDALSPEDAEAARSADQDIAE